MLLNTSLSKFQAHNGRSKFTYMYANADFIAMDSYLSENVSVETTPNTEESWQNIKHFLLEARDLFVPKFKIPRKPDPKWFRHCIKYTRNLRRKSRRRPSISSKLNLLLSEIELQNALVTAKEHYIHRITTEFGRKPRKLYSHLRSLTLSKAKPDFIIINNTPTHLK